MADETFPLKKKRNNNRKSEEMAKVADLSGIPKLMHCSLCGGIPSPDKVYRCQDGHLTCQGCHRKTPEGLCPKDLGPVTEFSEFRKICNKKCTVLKCDLYSYFFDYSIFNCNYANLGCVIANYGRDFDEHRQNCQYRPVLPCAFTECKRRVSPLAYARHLLVSHQVFDVDSDTYRVQVLCNPVDIYCLEYTRRRWASGLFNCCGLTFILLAEVLGPDIYVWVALGSAEDEDTEGRKFQCRLGFSSDKAELTWKGDVYPFENVYEKDVDGEEMFQIRKVIMAKKFVFKVGDQMFWYTDVEIKELLPEGHIPSENSTLVNGMKDMNIQGVVTTTPGLTTAEIFENIFEKDSDSEEILVVHSTDSTLEKPRPTPKIRTKEPKSAPPTTNKEGSSEFVPTPKPKPRPKKMDSSDDLQQNGGIGVEKSGESSENILPNGHSDLKYNFETE